MILPTLFIDQRKAATASRSNPSLFNVWIEMGILASQKANPPFRVLIQIEFLSSMTLCYLFISLCNRNKISNVSFSFIIQGQWEDLKQTAKKSWNCVGPHQHQSSCCLAFFGQTSCLLLGLTDGLTGQINKKHRSFFHVFFSHHPKLRSLFCTKSETLTFLWWLSFQWRDGWGSEFKSSWTTCRTIEKFGGSRGFPRDHLCSHFGAQGAQPRPNVPSAQWKRGNQKFVYNWRFTSSSSSNIICQKLKAF